MECVFLMVIWSEFRMRRYRHDDHRVNAPHFIISESFSNTQWSRNIYIIFFITALVMISIIDGFFNFRISICRQRRHLGSRIVEHYHSQLLWRHHMLYQSLHSSRFQISFVIDRELLYMLAEHCLD